MSWLAKGQILKVVTKGMEGSVPFFFMRGISPPITRVAQIQQQKAGHDYANFANNTSGVPWVASVLGEQPRLFRMREIRIK